MKKLMTTLLFSLSALALASCGGTSATTSPSGNTTTAGTGEVTLAYQFIGSYYEVASQFASFDFLANLNSDNTGTLYRLTCQQDASKNTLEESAVTWNVEEDRDGIKTMTFTQEGATPHRSLRNGRKVHSLLEVHLCRKLQPHDRFRWIG